MDGLDWMAVLLIANGALWTAIDYLRRGQPGRAPWVLEPRDWEQGEGR